MKSQQSRDHHTDQNQEVIETCLISCAMSLSVVVAGSGDLRVFSICRGKRISCIFFLHAFIFKAVVTTWYFIFYAALINRVPKSRKDGSSISYGSYVGLSTAIGFLFLSGGARTFATSDEAGASNLYCSCYQCDFIDRIFAC